MAGMRMEVSGQEAVLAELAGHVARAGNPRGLFENIGMALVVSTQRRFEQGMAPDGFVWPPSYRALAEGGKTLVDSARLMQSITYNASDAGVEVGTNVLYAAVHQLGATIVAKQADALTFKIGGGWVSKKQVTIPARPFLGLDEDDGKEIIAIAAEWIAGERALP